MFQQNTMFSNGKNTQNILYKYYFLLFFCDSKHFGTKNDIIF